MKRLLCFILGHKYSVYAKPVEDWGKGVRWLKCKRCKKDFVINDNVRVLLPMDFELKDMYKWNLTTPTLA